MRKLFIILTILSLTACDRPNDTVKLVCGFAPDTDKYIVTAKIYDDRAEIQINEYEFVLEKYTDTYIFSNADATFVTINKDIGFVVNHNNRHFSAPIYGKYLLKINGNEYPPCKTL